MTGNESVDKEVNMAESGGDTPKPADSASVANRKLLQSDEPAGRALETIRITKEVDDQATQALETPIPPDIQQDLDGE